MQVENNDSIKEYYVKLHNMYKNAVNMLTAINQSLSTKASEITIDLANTDNTTTTVRIPSFLYLENKIEQLDNNFSNLFDMPNSGEAWFSKSSNMYKLKMIKSNVAPLAPEFSTNNIYASLKDTNILKDLVSPRTFLKIDIDNLPDNISKMYMKKFVIFDKTVFDDLSAMNISSYDEFVAAIYNYNKGVDYEEYDSELKLPIRKDTYKSQFKIVDIPTLKDTGETNPWTDTTNGNHKHLSYKLYLDTLEYQDQEDSSIVMTLKVGDTICLGNELVVYKIKNVDFTENSVIVEEMVGHVALQTYDENSQMQLSLYNDNYAKYHYVEVPLEENPYICIFLGTIYNNVRSLFSSPYIVDLNSIYIKDDYGNFIKDSFGNKMNYIDYYNSYCTNIGDLILGITESAYPQLSNYTAKQLNELQNSESVKTAVSGTINGTDILKVVPINKHLTDDVTSEDVINLHSQKNDLNSRLSTVQDNIDQTYSTMISTDFSQNTTITQEALQSQLSKYYTERTTLQKQLNAVIDNINSKASDLNGITSSIKYRIRGITNIDDLEELIKGLSDVKCSIVSCEVQYKYKSTSKDTTSLTVINSSTFTDWNRLFNQDRERKLVFDTGINSFGLQFEDYKSTDNIIKWNQIDIPIQSGEDVVIRVRYKLNIGQPFVNIYTPWSDEVTVIFPAEYNDDVELKTILEQNEDDSITALLSKKLMDDGYEEHITNKVVSSDQIFFHQPEYIYSGFNTAENNLISLKDKLIDMDNYIEKYRTYIENESNGKFEVSISFDNTSVVLNPSNINKINIYNSDHITGKFIKKEMTITIKNTGDINVNLYSIFPGDTSTPLLTTNIDSYNKRLETYERVPLMINNEISPQYLGQWIYFRETNPYTSADIYHNTIDQRNSDEANARKGDNLSFLYSKGATDYIGKDNSQVLLGYRARSVSNDEERLSINSMIDVFGKLNNWISNPNVETKEAVQSAIRDNLKILNVDELSYNERSWDYFLYTNSKYHPKAVDADSNVYLMMFEDIQGKNSNGQTVWLDDNTSITNFLANYSPAGFTQDSDFSGAFLYPNIDAKSQIMTSGGEQSSLAIKVGQSVSIPIIFEYYLDGSVHTSITKSLFFDIRNSLITNPINYMIQITGNYDMTATGDVYSSFDNVELQDEVTQ